MKPNTSGLADKLRDATQAQHDALDHLPFFRALKTGTLPRQSALSYLRGLGVVHALVETALQRNVGDAFGPWQPGSGRLEDLEATLEAAGAAGYPDVPDATEAAIELGDRILLRSGDRAALLGPYYMLERSQLEGEMLRKHFAAVLGLSTDRVLYFRDDHATLKRGWQTFGRALDGLDLDAESIESTVRAAQETLEGIGRLAEAAFPYDESELRHRISAINPEAGRHAMPQSDAEIARALRCAAAAWQRFPYLEMRFGRRGRRFTNSDSCWLVSLYDLEEAIVVRSLVWLRGVLASRGLPTMILEDHLQEIDRDVGIDDPSRQRRATGFRATVERFRGERDTVLSTQTRQKLAEHWQQRLDSCVGVRVSGAVELLIGARLDTAIGIDRAWAQTYSWFGDPERFSRAWTDTVTELAKEMESALHTRSDLGH